MDLNQLLKHNATIKIEEEFGAISLYEAESLILVDWKRQVAFGERKACLLQALELIKHYQVKYLLINDQNIFYLSQAEKNWIACDWIESASASSLLKIGVVFLENYNMLINSIDFTSQLQKLYKEKGKIQLRAFTNFPCAIAWISPNSEDYGFL